MWFRNELPSLAEVSPYSLVLIPVKRVSVDPRTAHQKHSVNRKCTFRSRHKFRTITVLSGSLRQVISRARLIHSTHSPPNPTRIIRNPRWTASSRRVRVYLGSRPDWVQRITKQEVSMFQIIFIVNIFFLFFFPPSNRRLVCRRNDE